MTMRNCPSCGWVITSEDICTHCREGMCVDPPPERAKIVGDELIPRASGHGYLITVAAYCADCVFADATQQGYWCNKRHARAPEMNPACRFFEPVPESQDES